MLPDCCILQLTMFQDTLDSSRARIADIQTATDPAGITMDELLPPHAAAEGEAWVADLHDLAMPREFKDILLRGFHEEAGDIEGALLVFPDIGLLPWRVRAICSFLAGTRCHLTDSAVIPLFPYPFSTAFRRAQDCALIRHLSGGSRTLAGDIQKPTAAEYTTRRL